MYKIQVKISEPITKWIPFIRKSKWVLMKLGKSQKAIFKTKKKADEILKKYHHLLIDEDIRIMKSEKLRRKNS